VFAKKNAEKEPAYLTQMPLGSTANRGDSGARISFGISRRAPRRLRACYAPRYGSWMRLSALREQLSQYRPTDDSEESFAARMMALTQAPEACARSHFAPGHFTASAFVLSPDRRELVLIHHRKLGLWLQPGGHIDEADRDWKAQRGARSEKKSASARLRTLTSGGLFDLDIHAIPPHKQEPAHEHFDVRFAFLAGTRDFTRSEEVADVRWVLLEDAASVTCDASVLRAADKLRRLLG